MKIANSVLKEIAIKPNVPPKGETYSRISKIHKYWSRKPWSVVDQFISTYTTQGETVLDPFCGSGVIGLQTIKAGRNFIGSDLNPFAVRLTKETLKPNFNVEKFQDQLSNLKATVEEPINHLYKIGDDLVLYSIPNQNQGQSHNAVIKNKNAGRPTKVQIDLGCLPEISFSAKDSSELPDQEFPVKFYKDRFSYKGITKVSQLFSSRNLKALSLLFQAIQKLNSDEREMFELCLTNTLLHVSKLKSERVRPLGVNNYWIPDDFIEENVWWRFEDRCQQFISAKTTIKNAFQEFEISKSATQNIEIADATNLENVADASIDYILTDPPYGDAIQYSELSLVWNCWLGTKYDVESEIIINPEQGKDSDDYIKMLSGFVDEAFRVLKKNAKLTISFHSRDIDLWCQLARLLCARGFELENLYVSHGVGSPFTKNWAKFSPKSDIYITVKKAISSIDKHEPIASSEFLQHLRQEIDLSDMTQDQIYDFLVLASINATMNNHEIVGLRKKNIATLIHDFINNQ